MESQHHTSLWVAVLAALIVGVLIGFWGGKAYTEKSTKSESGVGSSGPEEQVTGALNPFNEASVNPFENIEINPFR